MYNFSNKGFTKLGWGCKIKVMKLEFLVDKKYTFLHAFNQHQHDEPFKGWSRFTWNIWEKHPQECYLLAGFTEWPLLGKRSLRNISIKAEKLLEKWLKAPEVKRLTKETEKYRDWLEKEWGKKGNKVLIELEKIIKIPLPKKKISVYVTHPKLKNGMAINKTTIVWGHKEDWPNYSIIYLCHEILHTILWDHASNITHAIIELSTDQELRTRLNKKSKYFKEGKFDIGHPKLKRLEGKILPSWENYLSNPKKNLKEFIQSKKKEISN